jgi:hypothetical protein
LLQLLAVGDNAAMQDEPPKAEPLKRKRRWFQFSLRTLMIVVTVFAIVGGWFGAKMARARRQQATVEAVRKSVGWVGYKYQVGPFGQLIPNATPPNPAWLRKMLGDDFFADVISVGVNTDRGAEILTQFDRLQFARLELYVTDAGMEHVAGLSQLQGLDLGSSEVTDAGLHHIQRLSGLRRLTLPPRVTDAGMRYLADLGQLQVLLVVGKSVTDAGLEHLKGLRQLETLNVGLNPVTGCGLARLNQLRVLYLGYAPITDDDLEKLRELKNLQRMDLRPGAYGGIRFTKEGVAKLRQALPNCNIVD